MDPRSFVNQFYQNFNIYNFVSIVPEPDIALLTPTGQSYDTAYGIYLDNIFMQAPNDPRIQASINQTEAKIAGFRQQLEALEQQAKTSFYQDCPNGQDAVTGESCTLIEYAAVSLTHYIF